MFNKNRSDGMRILARRCEPFDAESESPHKASPHSFAAVKLERDGTALLGAFLQPAARRLPMRISIEPDLRRFIEETLLVDQRQVIKNDDSFLQAGIIDSTGILELISFLEETYGIDLGVDDLIPENLDSINRVVDFVSRRLDRSQEGAAFGENRSCNDAIALQHQGRCPKQR
jgi:acyl carrier protein